MCPFDNGRGIHVACDIDHQAISSQSDFIHYLLNEDVSSQYPDK